MKSTIRKQLIFILKLACICLFAGRAWQHLVWDIPIRSLFWDQDLMEGIITTLTGKSWFEYATSNTQDTVIEAIKHIVGWFYLGSAILTILYNASRKWIGIVLLAGSGLLTILALLYYKEKFYHLGQLFEYTSQILSPCLLYHLVQEKADTRSLVLIGKFAIALTFICHGLYALGYYPQPGNYVDMTIAGFGFNEPQARLFLIVAGYLDIIIAIGLFIPRVTYPSLIYAILWGTLTALARVTTNFYWDFPWQSLNQWMFEFLIRVPHGLLPLFTLLLFQIRRNEEIRSVFSIPKFRQTNKESLQTQES